MPVLIAFFATPLGNAVLSALITILRKSGLINLAEALIVRFSKEVIEIAESLEVTQEYPGDKPKDEEPISSTNLRSKDGPCI